MAGIETLHAHRAGEPANMARAATWGTSRTMLQYARFLVVGAGNAILDLGMLNLLTALLPPHDQVVFAAENSVAVATALANSYVWNARWTFGGQGSGTLRERALFCAQALLNLLLNNVVLLAVVNLLPGGQGLWPSVAITCAKVCAMLVASSTSFVLLRAVVFRPR